MKTHDLYSEWLRIQFLPRQCFLLHAILQLLRLHLSRGLQGPASVSSFVVWQKPWLLLRKLQDCRFWRCSRCSWPALLRQATRPGQQTEISSRYCRWLLLKTAFVA